MNRKRRKKYRKVLFCNGSSFDLARREVTVVRARLLGLVYELGEKGQEKEIGFYEAEDGRIIVHEAEYFEKTYDFIAGWRRVESLDEVRQDSKYRPYIERLCL